MDCLKPMQPLKCPKGQNGVACSDKTNNNNSDPRGTCNPSKRRDQTPIYTPVPNTQQLLSCGWWPSGFLPRKGWDPLNASWLPFVRDLISTLTGPGIIP